MAKNKAADKKAEKNDKPRNYVQATAKMLELSKIGSALNLRIYQKDRVLGRIKVGLGGLWWVPRGWTERKAKRVPWKVFAQMMKEWPFGAQHGVRVQFRNDAVYWRAKPRGPLKRVPWDEFTRRMEMPRPKKWLNKPRGKKAAGK